MKNTGVLKAGSLLLLLALAGQVLLAQDTVTIPKSRLDELERQEAELKRLKSQASKTNAANAQLASQPGPAAPSTRALPPVVAPVAHVSPPIASLAPLKEGDVVEAVDLADYYRTDPQAAERRYGNRIFKVRGEVERFEKPLFIRDYSIVLSTPDRHTFVICSIYPPDSFRAVFKANDGSELVALTQDMTRLPLAKVGGTVVAIGRCKGLHGSAVKMSGCELVPPR